MDNPVNYKILAFLFTPPVAMLQCTYNQHHFTPTHCHDIALLGLPMGVRKGLHPHVPLFLAETG